MITEKMAEKAAIVLNKRLAAGNGLHGVSRDMLEAALSASPADVVKPLEIVRHKKRGTTYEVIGVGKMQAEHWIEQKWTHEPQSGSPPSATWSRVDMREVTIYRSTDDGQIWVRPVEEFNDGRFEPARIMSAIEPAGVGVETPPHSTHVMPTTSAWQWWAGSDEEWCTVGPEDTREAIIQAATNDSLGEFEHEGGGWNLGFYIVEARQDPLRLADWIEADRILERAEEGMADSDRVSSEYDDGQWFECTPEQEKDLEERVKRVCDEWQAEHRLVFSCATFSHTRNREHVIVELPDDRATTEGSDNG